MDIHLPIPLYTKKAAQMMTDWLWENGKQDVVERDATGRVYIREKSRYDEYEYLHSLFGRLLCRTYNPDPHVTLATDNRGFMFSLHAYTASELNLLACLILENYTLEEIKKQWGGKIVDKFIGKPCNPLVAMQRETVQKQLKQNVAEYDKKYADITAEFDAKIAELEKAKQDALNACSAAYRQKNQELWKMLDDLG